MRNPFRIATREKDAIGRLTKARGLVSLDGKTANFATRDLSCVVAGLHHGNWHFFETYKRTIWINPRNGRTILRCAGSTVKSNNSRWWNSLLAKLHVRKLKAIVI